MTKVSRRDPLGPGEMFPADEPGYRVTFPRLRSGLKVRVVERGNALAPAVLLVHGWGCSAYTFYRNLPAIADAGFRGIAIDLKGHGLSDKPLGTIEYTVDSLVDHLRDILDALDLEQPALAGHSLGGSLIYHFAARYPDRVCCLALLSPVGLKGVPLLSLYKAITPQWSAPVLRRLQSRTLVRIALHRVYGHRGHFTARDVEEFFAPCQFPEYALAMRELLHCYDWKASENHRLRRVNVPSIGLWGDLDHLMPRDGMSVYVPLLPQIVLRSIPGAGHLTPQETADDVNAALVELLRSIHG
jgi:pimeloyl-ACP methyl ester carboxylesterase